jgi:hypothetical protein
MNPKQLTYKDLYSRLSAAHRQPMSEDVIRRLEDDLTLCWRCMSDEERTPFFAPEVIVREKLQG